MKRVICIVLLVICVAVFCFTGYKLVNYFAESRASKEQYNSLAQIVESAKQEAGSNQHGEGDSVESAERDKRVAMTDPETGEEILVLPEYAPLYEINPDLVGWIEIPGTNINYPVVQSNTPNWYLYLDFNEEYSVHGTIYAREVCDVFAPSDNVTIYGHHMVDGTMFHELDEYESEDFWREHKTFTFDTILERHEYEVLAVFMTTATLGEGFAYHRFVDAADAEEFQEYVDTCKHLALYDTGVDAEYGDKLITLSTCESSLENGRLVLVAKRIAE